MTTSNDGVIFGDNSLTYEQELARKHTEVVTFYNPIDKLVTPFIIPSFKEFVALQSLVEYKVITEEIERDVQRIREFLLRNNVTSYSIICHTHIEVNQPNNPYFALSIIVKNLNPNPLFNFPLPPKGHSFMAIQNQRIGYAKKNSATSHRLIALLEELQNV